MDVVAKGLVALVGIWLVALLSAPEYAKYTMLLAYAAIFQSLLAGFFDRIYLVGRKAFRGREWCFRILVLEGYAALAAAMLVWYLNDFDVAFALAFLFLLASNFYLQVSRLFYQGEMEFGSFARLEVYRAGLFFLVCVAMILWFGVSSALPFVVAQGAATFAIVVGFTRACPSVNLIISPVQILRAILWRLAWSDGLLFIYVASTSLFSQLGVIIASSVLGESAVATFGSALRYYLVLGLAVAAVHAYFLPTIALAKSVENIRELYSVNRRISLLSIPLFLIAIWLSGYMIPIIDGGKYPDAVQVFRILCVAAYVNLVLSPYVALLMNGRYFAYLATTSLIGVGLFVGLGTWAAGEYGVSGIALTHLVGYAYMGVSFCVGWRYVKVDYMRRLAST